MGVDSHIFFSNLISASNGFNQPLVFAPTSAPMMGGTTIYVTGPCFSPEQDIVCRFDTQAAVGRYINQNKAACIMPLVDTTGYVDLALSINNGADFSWKGLFFVGILFIFTFG